MKLVKNGQDVSIMVVSTFLAEDIVERVWWSSNFELIIGESIYVASRLYHSGQSPELLQKSCFLKSRRTGIELLPILMQFSFVSSIKQHLMIYIDLIRTEPSHITKSNDLFRNCLQT